MKRFFLHLVIFTAFTGVGFGQGPHNVIIFSQGGETFTLFINGVKQNESPVANVKVTDLMGSGYQLRVLFDKALPGEFSKNMTLPEGSSELTYQLKKNSKGAWTVGFVSEAPYIPSQRGVPVSGSNPSSDQEVAPATTSKSATTARPPAAPVTKSASDPRTKPANSPSQDVITTKTTTTAGAGTTGGTIDIRMSADENNVGINVSVDDRSAPTSTTTVVTTQTTTQVNVEKDEYVPAETVPVEQVQAVDNRTDEKTLDCQTPMRNSDFSKAVESISSKSFEDSKLSIAKQITRGNCLSSSQVKEIMELFSFEDTRLQFAKYAYDFTFDKGNYYQVNDAFDFESTIEELDSYLQKK